MKLENTPVSEIMTKKVKTIDEKETAPKALSLMEREHVKELPVLSGGKLAGLITFHKIITYPRYNEKLKLKKLMVKPPELKEDDNLLKAIKLMNDSGITGLPVTRDDSVVGFVSDYDLLSALKKKFSGLTVNDFMKELATKLSEDDTAAKARKLMFYNNKHSLPVVRKGVLIGVLNQDAFFNLYVPHESMGYGVQGKGDSSTFLNVKIKDLLTKPFHTAMIGAEIKGIINELLDKHLTSLVIVNEQKEPVGFLERFDLINHLYKEQERGVFVEFSGLELDLPTNSLLTKVIQDHLNKIKYLVKQIAGIKVRIKPLHAGEGVRKFELKLKIMLTTGISHRVKKTGYALRECLDEALTDAERIMKKEYQKSNP